MLKTIALLIIGLLPSIWSLWVIRKTQQRIRTRNRQRAQNYSQISHLEQYITPLESDRYYLEGVGYLIGDISCKFNARSGYVRCAVNPSGPCQGCRHYESRELTNNLTY
jgi:hypothetical protein